MTKLPSGQSGSVRRYLIVIQDARGYPEPGADLEPAPPEGPEQPVMRSAVLADDYERVARERDDLAHILFSYGDRLPNEALEDVWESIVMPVVERG